ncbi:MAG TPA: glycoside hydrolase family 43 protein [Ktedonobacterales bacterium]|nr:glycoside hydrolase family 43 protein [Ktedonobacterales bacterium]
MAVALSLVGVGMVARLNVTTPATTPATTSATIPTWARAQPAIRSDFADPAVLVVGNTYYAYATNAYGKHIQVARSLDLREWTLLPDALPVLPAWADSRGDWVWAPAVLQVGQRFLMYYTARDAASAHQCIGVATSASPIGPFTDHNVQPLICQLSLGGSIDPAPFRDGSALYLYFKSDGNCCRQLTHLWGQRLTPDGLALVDSPVSLLTNDQPWEGNVVEAPNMLAHDGQYDLFYSANDYATDRYAVGYARCQTPLGPCVKTTDKPLLASAPMSPEQLSGPGGGAFFEAAGATWIAFHAWNLESSGSVRSLMIERLGWRGDTPVVPAPATSPLRSSA